MDVVGSVAFGTEVDSQKNPDDPFVKNCRTFFEMSLFKPLLILIREYSLCLSTFLWSFHKSHCQIAKHAEARVGSIIADIISEGFRMQPTHHFYP